MVIGRQKSGGVREAARLAREGRYDRKSAVAATERTSFQRSANKDEG